MKNKLNNTVIKVLNREHGKKVIEWWKSQGVDTNDYLGLVDESRGYKAIYYGLVHGIFRNVDASTVNVIDLKVIELPSIEQPKFFAISPEDWKEYQDLKKSNITHFEYILGDDGEWEEWEVTIEKSIKTLFVREVYFNGIKYNVVLNNNNIYLTR